MKCVRDRSDASPSGGVRSDEDLGRERDGGGDTPGKRFNKVMVRGSRGAAAKTARGGPYQHVPMQTAVQKPNKS